MLGAAPHQNWKTNREVLESLDKMLRVKFCTFFLGDLFDCSACGSLFECLHKRM